MFFLLLFCLQLRISIKNKGSVSFSKEILTMRTRRKTWNKNTSNSLEQKINFSRVSFQNLLMMKRMEIFSLLSMFLDSSFLKYIKHSTELSLKKFKEFSTNRVSWWAWIRTLCDKFTITLTKFAKYLKPYALKKLIYRNTPNPQANKFKRSWT